MPGWVLHYEYAEQYPGIQPQDVPNTVTVHAWERWLLLRDARASRRAWQASKQVDDWMSELTPEARSAMRWAMDNPNAESD